jgi:hypothetical protein
MSRRTLAVAVLVLTALACGGPADHGGGRGHADGGGCHALVERWSDLYEAANPGKTVDRKRMTRTCVDNADIDNHPTEAACWDSATSLDACTWGPGWLDDGPQYDGWTTG